MKAPKLLLALAAVVVLGVVAVVVALFTDFDSPELGRLALAQIGKSTGLELRAEGFRLNLLRGLELEKVEAKGALADGEVTASIERLVLEHRPADLLGGTLTVTEMVLVRPRVELTSTAEAPAARPPAGEPVAGEPAAEPPRDGTGGGTSIDLAISTIRLEDAVLVQRSTRGAIVETTEIRGLDLELRDLTFGARPAPGDKPAASGELRIAEIVSSAAAAGAEPSPDSVTTVRGLALDVRRLAFDPADASRLSGVVMNGEVKVEEVISGTSEARKIRSAVALDAGRLELSELRLTAPQGDLAGRLEADVAGDPVTYSLALGGDGLSTGLLLGIGDLAGLGTSSFQLTASGSGSKTRDVVGKGHLTINEGTLPDHPALAQVEKILGNAALVGAGYEAFPLDFDVRTNRVHLARCELRTGPMSLALSGWLDLDGPLEMKLSVLTPRQGLVIKEIPVEVLDALAEDDGRVNLPMLVTGTSAASAVGLDQDFLKKQGQRYVRKTAEKELTKALSGLFGKKKKKDG